MIQELPPKELQQMKSHPILHLPLRYLSGNECGW